MSVLAILGSERFEDDYFGEKYAGQQIAYTISMERPGAIVTSTARGIPKLTIEIANKMFPSTPLWIYPEEEGIQIACVCSMMLSISHFEDGIHTSEISADLARKLGKIAHKMLWTRNKDLISI